MFISETDPDLLMKIRKKDIRAIIKWFNQRKNSLYKLAFVYSTNIEDIQTVFFDTIKKVHVEVAKQKNNASIENWLISVFLEECKKRKDATPDGSLFDQVDPNYKDELVLTYVLGLPHEKIAIVLGTSVENVKENIQNGIQSVSGAEVSHYQYTFIDYINRTLNRSDKIELEIHLHTCQICQIGLVAFQKTIAECIDVAEAIHVPADFLDPVLMSLDELEEMNNRKKRKRIGISAGITSSIVAMLLIAYLTNGFTFLYYSWLDFRDQEDEQLLEFLKYGLGEELNLEQENNGVRVTIKSAIADDYQTLIYYEVENLRDEEKLGINSWVGAFIANEGEVLETRNYPINSLPVQPVETDEDIFKGKISLLPIKDDNQTIKLNISKLQKIETDSSIESWLNPYDDDAFVNGHWNFEIPVVKQPSKEYPLAAKAKVGGIPVEFEKLTLAPTATVLQYGIKPELDHNKFIHELVISEIKTEEKVVKVDPFAGNFPLSNGSGDKMSFINNFDSLYFEDPDEIKIHFTSLSYYVNDSQIMEIDIDKGFPQTFDYLGSEISIDELHVGDKTTNIKVSTGEIENRPFDSFHFDFLNKNTQNVFSMGMMEQESVFVDQDGTIYSSEDFDFYEHAVKRGRDTIRHVPTRFEIELQSQNPDEKAVPNLIQIHGYQGTTYLDDVIQIQVK
ncbi:DUF4179 domain-containing protein [Bacillus sinesaloumensis]|uniref:DUF4179 domain-containing protein n=1 Tax=Litchfieldia sinesaloumensis TaxID=1926280 RepID=UPI0009888015|nr:DUF4179 domain-containing protein [Bacillus sinesaloumensis]